jgi:1-deoxy-D-xylulose-5-phosphate reductoisomerase
MVMAGEQMNRAAEASGACILPVDSEHSAVFQAMRSGQRAEVRRVWLTASGGPFRDLPLDALGAVTPERALQHPNWVMGPKVTVDSATMMNKALEVVEAKWLFRLDVAQVGVLIHPQSVVHSLVEFCDGSTIAQLGVPDMRVPIQYALTYPERRPSSVAPVVLAAVRRLEFEEPDLERFPALSLGYRAAEAGGTMGAVLNAANEAAVQAFLDRRLPFPDIPRLVADVMGRHRLVEHPTMEDIDEADRWARREAAAWVTRS